ncbi:ATP-binding protein [uncultured Desulfobacter sp.]|uniref:ATP-binding protein n=1 Tax=uncultured Desulfobacter sp. TaxID=240139 RepID=UPI002AAA9622|nr:transporter substrate-binding domain-containing protein [uncultured Desulfobacter sp.]
MTDKIICFVIWIILLISPIHCFASNLNLTLTPEERSWLTDNHTVRIRVGNTPPFMISDDKIQGLAIDYIEQIFTGNGIRFHLIRPSEITWPQSLKYISNHEIVDMVPTATITEERKEKMLFTDEYIFAPLVIFTRSDANFVGSMEDLRGKTVSVEEGFALQGILKREYPWINLKVVSSTRKNYTEIPIKDVSTGMADAYIGNLLTTTYIIQLRGYTNVKVAAPTPFENHNQAMAIRSDWPELVSIINKSLQAMTPEEHAHIRNRWLNIRYEYGISTYDVLKWMLWVIGISALFIGFFINWNNRLKKEVENRKIIEKYLKRSQRMACIGNWRLSIDTKQVVWSEELYRIHGRDKDLAPPPYTEHDKLFLPDSWERLSNALTEAITNGTPYEIELEIVKKDETTGWMWEKGEAERDAKGNIISIWGTAQDITERKRSEKKLESTLNYVQTIVENSPIGISTFEKNGLIVTTNQSLARIFGGTVEKIVGLNIYDIEFWKKSGLLAAAEEALKDDVEVTRNLHYMSSFNKKCWVNATFIPFMYENKKQLMLLLTDTSKQKQAEEKQQKLKSQLIQAQKMESIGRLAGGVAHDFNNMLSIILGNVEIVMEELHSENPYFENLEEIYKAAERSSNLTRQLLAFARKQIIDPKVLNLNDVVSDMLKMLKRLIGEDIDLTWQPSDSLKPVKMDPSQVDQIMANLCVNARDAIKSVGKVTIETDNVFFNNEYCREHPEFKPGEYVMIAVSDDGIGMDKNTVRNIFEPFFTTKEIGEGNGLGLATIFGIVKQNNGFINVYSEPGEGTTFKIYLPPYHQSASTANDHLKEESAPTGTERILIVEDELSILKMTQVILQRLGYRVIIASSPVDAIKRIEKSHFNEIDLLITDVVMPEMNGKELAAKMKSLYPNLKCLFMSGYTANVIAHHGVLESGVHFINKPFSKHSLAKKVREVLDTTVDSSDS